MFKIRATAVIYEAFLYYNVLKYTFEIRRFTHQLEGRVRCGLCSLPGDGVHICTHQDWIDNVTYGLLRYHTQTKNTCVKLIISFNQVKV